MKLTKAKLVDTIRVLNEGESKYQARKIAGVTKQRVYQVWNEYLASGQVPDIGRTNGRPSKLVEQWEIDIVREAYEKYKVSASTLEDVILRVYGKKIGHNRVHKIMLNLGFAKEKGKKDMRKKDWIRYERRHSLTAVHLDWYYDTETDQWILPVIDDASRMLLALIETQNATTDASIQAQKKAR